MIVPKITTMEECEKYLSQFTLDEILDDPRLCALHDCLLEYKLDSATA